MTSIHCWESRPPSISRVEWLGLKPNWWSEMKPLEKRKDLISEAMMDSITLLVIGRRLIGLLLQGSVFAPFLCRTVMFADFQADGRWFRRGWIHQQRNKENFPEIQRDNWWKPEKEQGPERCLEELQPGQEEGMKELHLGPHGDCDRRGSLRAMSREGLGYHRKRVWWAGQGARPCQKHAICLGIWLWFHVRHWGPPSIVGRAETAYPG